MCLQAKCYDVINSRYFPTAITCFILFNTVVLMTSWATEPGKWYTGLNALDTIFVAVYIAEVAAKYLAYGPR